MADFGSGGGILGTVTVRTPFSMAAFTSSTCVFSGSLKRRRKLPCERSTRCHLSEEDVSSFLCSPLICNTRPSSTCTFTSCLLRPENDSLFGNIRLNISDTEEKQIRPSIIAIAKWDILISRLAGYLPGKFALKTWASAVSFQSTCVLATAAASRAKPGWSGNEGKMRESEKKASRGPSDAPPLRLLRPKSETDMVKWLRFWIQREIDERKWQRWIDAQWETRWLSAMDRCLCEEIRWFSAMDDWSNSYGVFEEEGRGRCV